MLVRALFGVLATLSAVGACDGGSASESDDDGPVTPSEGQWGAEGLSFYVSGTTVRFQYVDYGECSGPGCSTNVSVGGDFLAEIGTDGSFDQPEAGCSGSFTSATTAELSCSRQSDCGCTATRAFDAELDFDDRVGLGESCQCDSECGDGLMCEEDVCAPYELLPCSIDNPCADGVSCTVGADGAGSCEREQAPICG